MSVWLAGLLAVLIVVGGAVIFVLALAGFFAGMMKVIDLIEARLGEKPSKLIGDGIMLAMAAAVFGVVWYGVFAWLMGWPL